MDDSKRALARLGLLSTAALLAAGCGRVAAQKPADQRSRAPQLPPAYTIAPAPALRNFVRAARLDDAPAMWELLSAHSRGRLGPTLDDFRIRPAARLTREVGRFGVGSRSVLSAQVGEGVAVAAVTVDAGRRRAIYAAALRFERRGWRIELGDPLRIRILAPEPGGSVNSLTPGLAAEIEARARIVKGLVWLDGKPFDVNGGRLNDRLITMYGHAEEGVARPGYHFAIAFAQAGASITAVAWTFSSRP